MYLRPGSLVRNGPRSPRTSRTSPSLETTTTAGTRGERRTESSVMSRRRTLNFVSSELVVNYVSMFLYLLRSHLCPPDSAEVKAYKFEPSTGEEIVVQMTPVRTTTRYFGKCATYDLESEKNQLSRIKVTSPVDIVVLLHDKNQQSIHRELSIFYHLEGNLIKQVFKN